MGIKITDEFVRTTMIPKEKFGVKQETLEEAAENYKNQWLNEIGDTINTLDIPTIFKACAKWQQERSYSKEEVLWNISKKMKKVL